MNKYDADLLEPQIYYMYICIYYIGVSILYYDNIIYTFSSEAKLVGGPALLQRCFFLRMSLDTIRGEQSRKEFGTYLCFSIVICIVCKVINNDLWYLRLYTMFWVHTPSSNAPAIVYIIFYSIASLCTASGRRGVIFSKTL